MQCVLKGVWLVFRARLNAHYDVSVHLNETAVAIVGETPITRLHLESLYRLVVKTKVEDRVHHAWHGLASARANGEQKRVLLVTELLTALLFANLDRGSDLALEGGRIDAAVFVVLYTDVRRNCEAAWNR